MEEKTYEQLKAEATGLGLDFKGNIKKADLETLIEDYYESQAAGDFVQVQEEEDVEMKPVEVVTENKNGKIEINGKNMREATMKLAKQLRAEAMKTRVVRITNTDKRDASVTTTVYLSAENQYWGISKIVPLDEPVELEQCLIDTAKSIQIMNHVDEIVEGKRTGNKTFKMTNKYSISYEDPELLK